MENLTFGEQVKIILSRKGMTIKELAEQIEERTGKNMSRQNMTQRLKRDNFQEQDMRMIAEILGCSFRLSIMEQIEMETEKEQIKKGKPIAEACRRTRYYGWRASENERGTSIGASVRARAC